MVSFIQISLNNAVAMGDATYAALEGTRSPTIQTVLDYSFDPTANPGVGVLFGSSMLVSMVWSVLRRVTLTDTPFRSGL
jgi:hypothetical protein